MVDPRTDVLKPSLTQPDAMVRFDWGMAGLLALAPDATVVVIVDVLRFTTAVNVAVERGSAVAPAAWNDASAQALAREQGIAVAGQRERGELSLSPADLERMDLPDRLLLPSPNGSALTAAALELGGADVLAGCLRNATATAARASELASAAAGAPTIAVIAAGERWDDQSLRPALEDMIGAGAVIDALARQRSAARWRCSPEANAATAVFRDARPMLGATIAACASGQDLAARGWHDDLAIAAALDISTVAAELIDGAYVGVTPRVEPSRPDAGMCSLMWSAAAVATGSPTHE